MAQAVFGLILLGIQDSFTLSISEKLLSDENQLQGRVDHTSPLDSSFRPSHITSGCTETGCKLQNWFSSCCDAAKSNLSSISSANVVHLPESC